MSKTAFAGIPEVYLVLMARVTMGKALEYSVVLIAAESKDALS